MRFTKYSVQLVREDSGNYEIGKRITGPEAAKEIVNTVLNLNNSTVEKMGILCLDTKNNVIGIHILSIGTVSSSLVSIPSVFQAAFLNNAVRIVLFHNHPSGDCTPSTMDKEVTNKLIAAGDLMEIKVMDHIIVADDKYLSFQEQNLMKRS